MDMKSLASPDTATAIPGPRTETNRVLEARIVPGQHYVYLYKEPTVDGTIRYVGEGVGNRVDAILKRLYEGKEFPEENVDKIAARRWMNSLKRIGLAPAIEIVECRSVAEAHALETSLISALWSTGNLLNKINGPVATSRFAPLGLPRTLGDRPLKAPLTRQDFADLGGAVVVYISPHRFFTGDVRSGALPLGARSDAGEQRQRTNIHARTRPWWMMGRYVRQWAEQTDLAPRYLLGATGPTDRRLIWASLELDRTRFASLAPDSSGLYELPTTGGTKKVTAEMLDFGGYRGRLLGRGEFGPVEGTHGRHFGNRRHQFFDVVPSSHGPK